MRALVESRIDVIGGRLWEEGSEMKGMKSGKPGSGGGKDQTELLLRVIDVQSRVIEALSQAVMATAEVGGEEGEEDENEDEEKGEG